VLPEAHVKEDHNDAMMLIVQQSLLFGHPDYRVNEVYVQTLRINSSLVAVKLTDWSSAQQLSISIYNEIYTNRTEDTSFLLN